MCDGGSKGCAVVHIAAFVNLGTAVFGKDTFRPDCARKDKFAPGWKLQFRVARYGYVLLAQRG